jgi:hypothetical protein
VITDLRRQALDSSLRCTRGATLARRLVRKVGQGRGEAIALDVRFLERLSILGRISDH